MLQGVNITGLHGILVYVVGKINKGESRLYELLHRPEVVMFYNRLMDSGRGSIYPQDDLAPVMEFDILEDGRIAYMRVNRMINIWDDTHSLTRFGMWHYQERMHSFVQEIEDFEHLIIDLRGNTGGCNKFL